MSSSNKHTASDEESDSFDYDDPFYIELNSDVSDSLESDDEPEVTIATKSKVKVRATKSKVKSKKNGKSIETGLASIIDSTSKMSIGSKSSKKRLTNERKIIYYDDDPAKPVTAAGVILYRYDGKVMQILLINSRNKYEDIGGKIDQIDESIEEAAAREVDEETNGQITAEDIIDRLNKTSSRQKVYVKNSKYLIYIIKANDSERLLTSEDFGDYEAHDKIKRTIQWLPRDTAFSTTFIRGGKLNYRMKSKALKDTLVSMDKNKNKSKSMFR
jgi:8-oxo-dGTP pyrophosphatase MutT (NUDIX family)